MKLIVATHNPAKALRYKNHLVEHYPFLKVFSLKDYNISDKIDEPHSTAIENALHKARSYAAISGEVTLGIDEAVTTNFLPPQEQPGVYVRRLSQNRTELTDEAVIEHWKTVFAKYPSENKKFVWDFSIALYDPHSKQSRTITIEQRCDVASEFSKTITPGYPMSSFLMHEGDTQPYSELSTEKRKNIEKDVFDPFVKAMGIWINEFNLTQQTSL